MQINYKLVSIMSVVVYFLLPISPDKLKWKVEVRNSEVKSCFNHFSKCTFLMARNPSLSALVRHAVVLVSLTATTVQLQ